MRKGQIPKDDKSDFETIPKFRSCRGSRRPPRIFLKLFQKFFLSFFRSRLGFLGFDPKFGILDVKKKNCLKIVILSHRKCCFVTILRFGAEFPPPKKLKVKKNQSSSFFQCFGTIDHFLQYLCKPDLSLIIFFNSLSNLVPYDPEKSV